MSQSDNLFTNQGEGVYSVETPPEPAVSVEKREMHRQATIKAFAEYGWTAEEAIRFADMWCDELEKILSLEKRRS